MTTLRKYIAPRMIGVCVFILIGLAGCTEPEVNDSLVGYVEGEFVYVSAPQSGWIVSMSVREGDMVAAGDTLFELDKDQEVLVVAEAEGRVSEADARARNIETGARPEEIAQLEAQLLEAEARLSLAESDYDRMVPLLEKELISQADGDRITAERDQAEAAVVVANESIEVARLTGRDAEQEAARATVTTSEAAVGQAEWRLDQRSITSRISGRVEALYQRTGEFINAGSPVLSVLPATGIKVRFFVPQNQVASIETGDIVTVSINDGETTTNARVSFVATDTEFTPPVIYSIDSREKLVFMVEARLPEGAGMRPGVPVDVELQN
jgi:HlyD family secretion protein